MKRLLLFIGVFILTVNLIAQTGTGWAQQRAKMNFRDSINLAKGWMIDGTVVAPSVTEINYLNGVTSAIQTQFNNIKSGVFNVLDYGADNTGAADCSTEIQAAIDAALLTGGIVHFPIGTYLVNDSIVIDGSDVTSISVSGESNKSIIKANGSNSVFYLKDVIRFSMRDIMIYGVTGASPKGFYGLHFDNVTYSNFLNVWVWYHPKDGVFSEGGCWGNVFTNCMFQYNTRDGVYAVHDGTNENGNAYSFVNCRLGNNGDDGLQWAAGELNVNGCTIENNNGSGLELGSRIEDVDVKGAYISGNYFEDNDSSDIKIYTNQTPQNYASGVIIIGNKFQESDTKDDALITQETIGTYAESFQNSYIGKNMTVYSGTVSYVTKLESPLWNVVVETGGITATSAISMLGGMVGFGGVTQPIHKSLTVTAANGINYKYPLIRVALSSNVDITADPQIIAGTWNGQTITLFNSSSSYTLTIENEDNGGVSDVSLTNSETCVLGLGEQITLQWYTDTWYEVFRSNINDIYAPIDDPTFTTGITLSSGDLALGANNLTMTGDIGASGSEVNHIYTDTLTVTNSADLADVAITGAVIKKTIGVTGETGVDFNFSNAANHTAENIDLGAIVPAKSQVLRVHVVCTETCANSGGAVDITFRAGNASAGEQFFASASCDDANEVLQIDNAATTIPVMNWASATNVFIGGDPDQNWSTMTAGRWDIYVTYIYFGDL